jgi:hypothetical protein
VLREVELKLHDLKRTLSEEPRASARGFFQRKSQYDLKATSVQNYTAIPPRSSERGILAFSREEEFVVTVRETIGKRG